MEVRLHNPYVTTNTVVLSPFVAVQNAAPSAFVEHGRHECERVFEDRLSTVQEKLTYANDIFSPTLKAHFAPHFGECMRNPLIWFPKKPVNTTTKKGSDREVRRDALNAPRLRIPSNWRTLQQGTPAFCLTVGKFASPLRIIKNALSCLQSNSAPYVEGRTVADVRAHVEEIKHELKRPHADIPLVLFQEVLLTVVRLARPLIMPNGACLVIGGRGLGRKTLARLAICLVG